MQLTSGRRVPIVTLAIGIAMVLVASPATAADEVWGFKGTLTSYVGVLGYIELPDVPVGNTVRGQVLFDDTTADIDASGTSGSYPYTTFALAFDGDVDLHIGVNAMGNIGVKNNDPIGGGLFRDAIRMDLGDFLLVPSLTMTVALFEFHLREEALAPPAVLTSDALPLPPPAAAAFTTSKLLNVIGYVDFDVTNFDVAITEFGPVGTPDLPLIPDSVTVETDGSVTWTFTTLGVTLCVSGCWVDPPSAAGFTYTMTNSALFTGIADFPSGFGSALEVSVGGASLGTFGPGDSVDFTSYPGGGVAGFVLTGIAPPSEVSSAEAFPLNLVFDSAAEFTMSSIVDEPNTLPLLGGNGLVGLATTLLVVGGLAVHRARSVSKRARAVGVDL